MTPTAAEPNLFVIVGGTGDLAARKLLPALYKLASKGLLVGPSVGDAEGVLVDVSVGHGPVQGVAVAVAVGVAVGVGDCVLVGVKVAVGHGPAQGPMDRDPEII